VVFYKLCYTRNIEAELSALLWSFIK